MVLVVAGLFFVAVPAGAQTGESAREAEALPPDPAAVKGEAASGEGAFLFTEGEDAPAAVRGSSLWVIVRMVLVLALSALAIYGVVFFFKRISRPSAARDPHLKVLARVPLGPGSSAAVVSVGGRAWLVGATDGSVSLIAEIDEKEALESMLLDDARKAGAAEANRFPNFGALLQRFRGRADGWADGSGRGQHPAQFPADNLRKQSERLKGL